MDNKNKLLAVLVMFMVGIILPATFSVDSASAYTASITTSNNISLDVSPSGDGTNIHSESINVVSDCRAGYNLTIATPSGSDLYQYTNNTQAGTASFTAVDGTSALSSNNNTNKWGYTLTSNPTGSTVFSPLSSTSSTLKTPSQTANPDSSINDTFNINYGIKVDNTIAPGTYQMADDGNGNAGSIVYYLTMDTTCTQYTVHFNPNGGTVTSGGSNPTQGIESGTPTKLMSADSLTAPTTASYTDAGNNTINGNADKLWVFWGWNTQIDGTGDWYKDKEEVEDLASVGSTITLYAQWKQATLADMVAGTPVGTEKVIDHNLMQDMRPETCYNSEKFTAIGTPYGQATLTDNRDGTNRSYSVAKLPDDLCWMTQNLNLGTSTAITLTPDDTDITENFALPASGPNDFSTASDQTNINKPTVLNNTTVPDYTVNSTIYSGKVNAYYSFAAATADTNTYSKSSSTILTTSICPKNWDLPSNTQYYNLRNKGSVATYNNTGTSYTGKNAGNEPYYFIYGGYRKAAGDTINTTSFNSPTSNGYLWTANNYTYRYGYGTYINSSGLYNSVNGTNYYKYYGLSMRCVASNGKATINYDGNGTTEYPVTGSIASQINVEINSTNTQANNFTRTGWAFNGWNTQPDGSGTAITASNASTTNLATLNIAPNSTVTLYAQWLPQYTITYVNNCQTFASANSSCTQTVSNNTSEQKITLNTSGDGSGTLAASNKWTTLTGWKITGWNTAADGSGTEYPASSTYSVTNQGAGSGVTLYAHWAPVYSIQYDGNGADNTDGMGTTDANGIKSVKQTNIAEGNSVTLLPSNYTRTGYGFAGWSTSPTAIIGGNDKIYGPMETISAPSYPNNATNTVTMYAVWVAAEKDGNNNPVYLQDFNKSNCDNLTSAAFDTTTGAITPGSVIALTDKRDNEVYTVAKLADDNCWMVENLRLEHAGTVGNNINDSSVTNQSLSQGYGGTTGVYGNFIGLADSESNSFHNSTASNSIYKSSSNPPVDTYDPANNTLEDVGTSSYPGHRIPRYNNSNVANALSNPSYTENYLNPLSPTTSGTYKSSTVSSYGNYYSWAAAKANTVSDADASAGTSICPFGWALPDANHADNRGVKHYNVLSKKYGGTGEKNDTAIMSNRFRAFPNNFLYSGSYDYSISGRGSYGYYWSRSSAGQGIRLYLNSTSLDPASASEQYQGFAIRCIANDAYTIQYDGNGADNPNGMGTIDGTGDRRVRQTGIIEDLDVLLLASNYKRTGYGFAGWSTDPDAWAHFTDNDNSNDPIIYGPMETIKAPAHPTSGDTITLYAVWVPAKTINNDPVYLQDFDSSQCSNLIKTDYDSTTGKINTNKNSIVALTDKRDNEIYTVARLADGNCWMVENLRLEHEGTIGNNINDSNVTNQSLSQGYGGTPGTYGSFVGLAESEPNKANFSSQNVSNTIYKSSANPPLDTYDPLNNVLEDIGTSDNPGYRFPRYNHINTAPHDDSNPNITMQDDPHYIQDYNFSHTEPKNMPYSDYYSNKGVYSYGNYYTWAAAMANTNKYSDSSSETASTSICPSNWHLPTSNGANKEFGTLSQEYGGTGNDQNYNDDATTMSKRFRAFPNNFMYSGVASSNYTSGLGRGTEGWYWSQSAGYASSYGLYVYPNRLNPSYGSSKTNGFSIRCLIAPNSN